MYGMNNIKYINLLSVPKHVTNWNSSDRSYLGAKIYSFHVQNSCIIP
jgi:hypothetical protein